MISIEDIMYISEMCKLKFTEDEAKKIIEEFTEIINCVDKLGEVNTENVSPTYFINYNMQLLREDVVEEGLSKEDALRNAPEEQYGYFKLLNVMD